MSDESWDGCMILVAIFIGLGALVAAATAFSDWAKTVDATYWWILGGLLFALWLWFSFRLARRQAQQLREFDDEN